MTIAVVEGASLAFGAARFAYTGRCVLIGRCSFRTTVGRTVRADVNDPVPEVLDAAIEMLPPPGRGAIGIAVSRTLLYAGYPSQVLPERMQLLPSPY